MRVSSGLVLTAFLGVGVGGCSCGPPPPPVQLPGQGKPITGPVDAGDPDLHDSGPVVCTEDGNEPNDARASATSAASGTAIDGTACGGNDDFYAIAATTACDVDAHVELTGGTGALGMLMFDPDGQLVGSSTGFESVQDIHVTAQKDGAYAVRLRSGQRDAVEYALTMTTTCASDLTCPADDAHEPNDGPAQLATMSANVPLEGVLCGQNEDWYLVPVSLGCIADNKLDFDDSAGDIDLDLLRADGTSQVATSDGTSNEERITKVVTEGGMMLRVHLFNADPTSANSYHLVANEICLGALGCPSDDPFEPNNDKNSATPLFATLDEVIGAVCGNDDFYTATLSNGCTFNATLSFQDAEGDLDLELQDDGGNQLAISQGSTDSEQISFVATSDLQQVNLRVFGFSGASNTYRLHVEQTTCP